MVGVMVGSPAGGGVGGDDCEDDCEEEADGDEVDGRSDRTDQVGLAKIVLMGSSCPGGDEGWELGSLGVMSSSGGGRDAAVDCDMHR